MLRAPTVRGSTQAAWDIVGRKKWDQLMDETKCSDETRAYIEKQQSERAPVDIDLILSSTMDGPTSMPGMFRKSMNGPHLTKMLRVVKADKNSGLTVYDTLAPQGISFGNPQDLPDSSADKTMDTQALGAMFGDVVPFLRGPDTYNGRPKTHADFSEDMSMHSTVHGEVILHYVNTSGTWQIGDYAPLEHFAGSVKVLHKLIFNDHIMRRAAYETPPELVTYQKDIQRFGMLYFQIGKDMEATLFRTALGRFIWGCQDVQLANAFHQLLIVQATMSLVYSQKGATTRTEQRGEQYSARQFEKMLDKEQALFECLKKRDGDYQMANQVGEVYRYRKLKTGDVRCVVSVRAAAYQAQCPWKRDFIQTGIPKTHPDSYTAFRLPNIARIFHHTPLALTSWKVKDAFKKAFTLGYFAVCNPLANRNIIAKSKNFQSNDTSYKTYFDETNDFEITTQETLFDNSLLYDHKRDDDGNIMPDEPKEITNEGVFILEFKLEEKKAGDAGGDGDDDDDDDDKRDFRSSDTNSKQPEYILQPKTLRDLYSNCTPPLAKGYQDWIKKRIKAHNADAANKDEPIYYGDEEELKADEKKSADADLRTDLMFKRCFKYHIPVFLPIYDFRPSATYVSEIAVFYKPGAAKTLVNLPDYMVGVSAKIKHMFAHFTVHTKCATVHKEYVYIMDNVFVDEYVAGNDESFWTRADRDEYMLMTKENYRPTKSRFAVVCRPTESIQTRRFDITGNYDQFYRARDIEEHPQGKDVVRMSYSTAEIHSRFWGWKTSYDANHVIYQPLHNPRGKRNTIVCRTKTLYVVDTGNGIPDHREIARDCTHWGDANVYPGCRSAREGQSIYTPDDAPWCKQPAAYFESMYRG